MPVIVRVQIVTEGGYQTATASVTVTNKTIDHYEYKDLEVTVDADPKTIAASGGTSSISATATWKYRAVYSDSTTGEWENGSGTPTLSGGNDTGFSRSGNTVTASVNSSTSSRSTTVTASYEIGDLSDSDTVTITQSGNDDDFEWIDTSISMDTDGSSVTASFKSSGNPSFNQTDGIHVEVDYKDATKSGTVKISISDPSSFSDGDNSASVTGTCGTASDVLDITVHKPVFTYYKKVVTTLSPSTIQWSEKSTAMATLHTTTYRDGVNMGTATENVTSSGFTAYSGIGVIIENVNQIRAASNTASSIGSVNIKSDYSGADEYEDAVLTIEKKQYYIPITVSEDGSGGYEIVVDEYNDGSGAALPCSVTLTFVFTDGVKPTVTLSAGQNYATFTPLGSGHGNLESVTLDPSSYDDHCEHYTFSVSVE